MNLDCGYCRMQEIINVGEDGLIDIIRNPEILDVVLQNNVNSAAKERIYELVNSNHYNASFFYTKDSDSTIDPPRSVLLNMHRFTRLISDKVYEWYLMLYCISIATDTFKDKILKYIDTDFVSDWVDSICNIDYFHYHALRENNRYCSSYNKWCSQLDFNYLFRYDEIIKFKAFNKAINMYVLSAGYHYSHIVNIDKIYNVAIALYIAIIQGRDFYEVLSESSQVYHDIIPMIKKNIAIKALNDQLIKLKEEIAEIENVIIYLQKEGNNFTELYINNLQIEIEERQASLEKEITAYLANKLHIKEEEISSTSTITRDLGADSLDLVEMIMDAEKTYNITIADEEAERIATITDLSKLICKKLYQDQIKAIKLIQKS